MSKPIYEPTPSRWDASLQFGEDQLFRRPAPSTGITASFGRANCEVNTSTLDYVEPDFVTGADATFERTIDGLFNINSDERFVLEQGNPGLYAISINVFDVVGNAGKDTLVRVLMTFMPPQPTNKLMLPGWFDSGEDNSAYEMTFPILLDSATPPFEFVPPPWTHLLYMNVSDEDLVFRLQVSVEEDTVFIATTVNVILSVTRIVDATLTVTSGSPFS